MSKNKPDDYLKPPAVKTNIVERAAALRKAMQRAATETQEPQNQPATIETGHTHSADIDLSTPIEPTAKIENIVLSNDGTRRPTFAERMNADRQAAYEKNVRANLTASLMDEHPGQVKPKL